MRILVTNDDGIDSVGLHLLARAMRPHGEVVVGAPDKEYSGASAAIGSIHELRPEMHRAHIEGMADCWAVTGPPALCVLFARLGAFGAPFDLVVSGINPGANVGRAVYHSGTIGACLTARTGGVSGIAVSQAVRPGGVMGQGWDEMLQGQQWETAAEVASAAVAAFVSAPPSSPGVLNLNVPNRPIAEVRGWRSCEVGTRPMRALDRVDVVPKEGHEGSFHLKFAWGDAGAPSAPELDDIGAVEAGYVAATWLSTLHAMDHAERDVIDAALDALF